MVDNLRNLTNLTQAFNANPDVLNILTNANYLIAENCSDRAFGIHEIVEGIKILARSALVDAQLSRVDSDSGFKTIFKEDKAQQAVVAILGHIYYFRGKRKLRPRPDALSSPRLSCVTKDSVELYGHLNMDFDSSHRCLVGGPRFKPIQAFYAEGKIYTFLCPAFLV